MRTRNSRAHFRGFDIGTVVALRRPIRRNQDARESSHSQRNRCKHATHSYERSDCLALATAGERSVRSLLDLNLLSEMLSDRTEVLRRSRQAMRSLLYFEGEQSK